ncbi:MAG: hypothetical protein Udaeo2_22900 [Candidatus Udaeobacter sp.]|nr:MAG: hypothetical protein Udaeo2_22900 [Candidatus Udaeobacter sp.]
MRCPSGDQTETLRPLIRCEPADYSAVGLEQPDVDIRIDFRVQGNEPPSGQGCIQPITGPPTLHFRGAIEPHDPPQPHARARPATRPAPVVPRPAGARGDTNGREGPG